MRFPRMTMLIALSMLSMAARATTPALELDLFGAHISRLGIGRLEAALDAFCDSNLCEVRQSSSAAPSLLFWSIEVNQAPALRLTAIAQNDSDNYELFASTPKACERNAWALAHREALVQTIAKFGILTDAPGDVSTCTEAATRISTP